MRDKIEFAVLIASVALAILLGFGFILILVSLVVLAGARLFPWVAQPNLEEGASRLRRGAALVLYCLVAMGVFGAFLELSGGDSSGSGFAIASAVALFSSELYALLNWDRSRLVAALWSEARHPLDHVHAITIALCV